MKKLLIAAASLATLTAPIAASAQPAWGGAHDGVNRTDGRGYNGAGYNGGGYNGAGYNGGGDYNGGGWRDAGYGGGDHRDWRDGDYRRGGEDNGAAFAAGLFGLFLGAALSNSYGYGYDHHPYQVRCHWETQAYGGPWGSVSYQQVRVCR